jgi:DNA polymerase-1
MSTVMIVDGSVMAYQAHNTTGDGKTGLKTSFGEPTGLRYGFIRQLRSYKEKTGADKVIVCWDTPAPILKATGRAEYKANRESTPNKQKMYGQLPQLRNLLSHTCYSQAEADGYEADDLMGFFSRKLGQQGHRSVIVTTDRDMYQLVCSHTWIMSTQKTKNGTTCMMYDSQKIRDEFGFNPQHLLFYRAAVGDESDNLEPAVKVSPAEKVIIQGWLSSCDTRPAVPTDAEWYGLYCTKQAGGLSNGRDLAKRISDARSKLEANMKIMSLMDPPKVDLIKGAKDPEWVKKEFERLEFKSLVKFVNEICGVTVEPI